MDEHNPDALDKRKWEGKNYLGECITTAMHDIIDDQHYWIGTTN